MGDSEREFNDLKAKMKSQRLSFNYKLKSLEKKLEDFSQSILDQDEEEEQKELAREAKQIEKDIRRAWEDMEKLNIQLTDSIVIVNKSKPIKDGLEAGIEKLFNTHSEYMEKWETIKQGSDRGNIFRNLTMEPSRNFTTCTKWTLICSITILTFNRIRDSRHCYCDV